MPKSPVGSVGNLSKVEAGSKLSAGPRTKGFRKAHGDVGNLSKLELARKKSRSKVRKGGR